MHALIRAVILMNIPFTLGTLVTDHYDAGFGRLATSDAAYSVVGRGYSIVNVVPTTITEVTSITLPATNISTATSANSTASYPGMPSMTNLNATLASTTSLAYSSNSSSTGTASLATLTDPINPKVTVVRNRTSMATVNNTSVDNVSYLNIYTWINSNGVSSTSTSTSQSNSIGATMINTTSTQVVGLATTSQNSGSDMTGTTASTGQVRPTPSSDASRLMEAPSVKYHFLAAGMSMGVCLGLALLL